MCSGGDLVYYICEKKKEHERERKESRNGSSNDALLWKGNGYKKMAIQIVLKTVPFKLQYTH